MMRLDGPGGRQPSQRLPVNPRRHKVPPEHRKRVATACNACNVRRVKCSGEHPCRQCRSSSRECVYPAAVEKVSVSRTELEELKRKVEVYEKALQDTVPDPTRRQELLGPSASVPAAAASQSSSPAIPVVVDQPQFATSYLPQPRLSQLKSTEQSDDVQASTDGRLLQDPDGHARYLGETSGATFLDYLKEFMSTVLPLAYNDRNTVADGSHFLSSFGTYQTYDSRPLHDRDVTPLWLPPRAEMEDMLSELRYFIQDGNGNWPSGGIYWWGDLDSVPLDPLASKIGGVDMDKCRHLAFYDTAFAVISQASTMHMPPAGTDAHRSEYYYTRARYLLGNPLDITRFTLNDVPALALMGFYLIEMNRRDAAYMCVSNAMHISVMHGAHRGWVDERGTRVFWTLFVLDRWLSCLMGRPPTIMDDAIRLPLPCDAPAMPPAAGLRAHVELSRISSHIVCNTYRISPWVNVSAPLRHLENAIEMLEDWRSNLPPRLQLYSGTLSDDPACCLLHMGYNQLVILTIRPIFFAAVKKTFAERLVARQSSLDSHPQLSHIRRCVAAAELNIRLARHILALNHPRKLLQSGLHFIFNAAICLMLQELIYTTSAVPRDRSTLDSDLDFVIARFEEESGIGNNYGRDCANILRDLGVLVQRLRMPMDPSMETIPASNGISPSTSVPLENRTDFEHKLSWAQRTGSQAMPQQIHVGEGHALYDELVSWMEDDWQQQYGGYI
ncbi:Fc.00g113810.m01.CDS01 [Cosmosporella sp. VM-42]